MKKSIEQELSEEFEKALNSISEEDMKRILTPKTPKTPKALPPKEDCHWYYPISPPDDEGMCSYCKQKLQP